VTEPARPRVGAVLETCLYASDLDETARFYAEVLGLDPFTRSPGRHVFFRCGNAVFLLFNPERTQEADGEVPPHGARGPGHVAFAVPAAALEAWRAHLARCGTAVEREVEWPRGGRSIYVRDPAGNSVELTSPSIWSIAEEAALGAG
jgi:catechol 2,3-dioxygenase-like lactoylglutathione lyase family enzyme